MSAAEKAFMQMEGDITRAQCLARCLRELLEGDFRCVDSISWGGLLVLAGEVEDGLNAAVEKWTAAYNLKGRAA